MTAERMKELRNEKAVPFDDQRRPSQGIENFLHFRMSFFRGFMSTLSLV